MKFVDAQEVAEYFGLPAFTPDQALMVENFIETGALPAPDGCLGCDPAYIRPILGRMAAEPEPVKEKKSATRSSR